MTRGDSDSRSFTRRQALGVIGGVGAAALVGGCAQPGANAHSAGAGAEGGGAEAAGERSLASLSCVVTPSQTEGPYFMDEKLERSDVRVDPSDGSVRPGAPLRLRLSVSRADGNACTPVTGAIVDIWQCDALGVYSDVQDFQGLFDTRGKKFLRGHQVTGSDGRVEFLTVYPGWYAGRAVHIHFKVRLPAGATRSYEFTSQLYFDDSVTDAVHSLAPYNSKGRRDTLNARDGIFSRSARDGSSQSPSGPQLMVAIARAGDEYVGDYSIGLRMT